MRGLGRVSLNVLLVAMLAMSGCQKKEPGANDAAPAGSSTESASKPGSGGANGTGGATGMADEKALAVTERVMRALGGEEAWRTTRYVSWNFFEVRRHYWDRQTGDVRIESNDVVILMNLETKKGRVQKAGAELTDPIELASYLERGYAWWVNDSYWMFMPYKLRDPGVHLAYGGEKKLEDGRMTDVLSMTFDAVGLTPQNKYDVFVSKENDLVVAWAYYPDRNDAEPKFLSQWNGWQRFGKIMLATDHGQGKNWDIRVPETLPEGVFRSFEAVGA